MVIGARTATAGENTWGTVRGTAGPAGSPTGTRADGGRAEAVSAGDASTGDASAAPVGDVETRRLQFRAE